MMHRRSMTCLHVTRAQATSLLKAVRYTSGMQKAMTDTDNKFLFPGLNKNEKNNLPKVTELSGLEQMLLTALERIRDLETRRAAR